MIKRVFSWHLATQAQLYEIAYSDTGAPLAHRLEAGAELKRRSRQKYDRINYKKRAVYPR